VHGVVVLADGPAVERLRATGHRVDVVPAGRWVGILAAALRLRRVLRTAGGDVVHADGPKAALCALLATAGTATPVVWMRHDGSFDGRVARALASRCAAVVGVSRTFVDGLEGIRGPELRVVRHGVPEHRIDPAAAARALRAELGAPPAGEVAIQVGRIVANKGSSTSSRRRPPCSQLVRTPASSSSAA